MVDAPLGRLAAVRDRATYEALGRPFHVGAAALALGLALAPLQLAWSLTVAGVLGATVALAGSRGLGLLSIALILVGFGFGSARLDARGLGDDPPTPGIRVDGLAVVLEHPRLTEFGGQAPVELIGAPLDGRRMLARTGRTASWPTVAPGAVVRVAGFVRSPRRTVDFDAPAYLRSRGLAAEIEVDRVASTGSSRGGLAGAFDAARVRAERAVGAGLSSRDASLARGMVLGQDDAIPETVRDDFRRSGLAHLLAVSGQNVMLLGLLALPLLGILPISPRARLVVIGGLVITYVPLAGAGPSLQRAAVMGLAGIAAIAVGRPSSRLYALLLATVVTLALNPFATTDAGWQLSFAAVAGITLLAPSLRRPLGRLPRPIAEAVAVTVAATIATAPVLAARFGVVSLAALPVNVLALPAVAPTMWLGMCATAIGQVAVLGGPFVAFADAAATALGWLDAVPLDYLTGLARAAATLPWAQAEWSLPGPLGVAGAYLALAAVAFAAIRGLRRIEPDVTAFGGRVRTAPQLVRRALAVACLGALVLAGAGLVLAPSPPDQLTVRFLDVGQGDATLVQDGAGAAILFDGGRPDARVTDQLRAAGVKHLSAVVATHVSADHHGGLAEVLARYPVDLLIENGDGTDDETYLAMLAEARSRRIPTVTVQAGQRFQFGDLSVSVQSPEPRPPGPAPAEPNLRAAVTVVSEGDFDLLLSADAESPSLLPLDLPDVEAIKLPHHGSSDPGLPELLARTRPEIAAIEVGADNGYGHPDPTTLAALNAAGVPTWRTDHDGTVTLTVADGAMSVETER